MSWAASFVEQLHSGHTVKFRPHGNSKQPRIQSGQLVIVMSVALVETPRVEDIVLCKVNGKR